MTSKAVAVLVSETIDVPGKLLVSKSDDLAVGGLDYFKASHWQRMALLISRL